jgi:hypothetical protein
VIKKELGNVMQFARHINKVYLIVRGDEYWQPNVVSFENTLELISDFQLAITCNLNAETLTSIWKNNYISVTLWDKAMNQGYHLVGLPVKIDILSINSLPEDLLLSGEESGISGKESGTTECNLCLNPDVERKIFFDVEQIIEFGSTTDTGTEKEVDEILEEMQDESLLYF